MTIGLNIGGVWKDPSNIQVNIDGTWKNVNVIQANIDGTWKTIWESVGKYELLADVLVSAATSLIDFTGLNLSKEDEVLLVMDLVNPNSNTNSMMYLFVNNNLATSNYYSQRLDFEIANMAASRYNLPYLTATIVSQRNLDFITMRLSNSGQFTYMDDTVRVYGGSAIEWSSYYGASTFTISSITQLTITSAVANSIGAGSRFRLYRIGGKA